MNEIINQHNIGIMIANKNKGPVKFSINNKKFVPSSLHNERFFDWFDKEFNIPPIVQK